MPIFVTRNAVYGDFLLISRWIAALAASILAFEVNQTATQIFVQTLAFATSSIPT